MEKPFRLTFSNGREAAAVRVYYPIDLSERLNQIGLQKSRPILAVVGGTSQISEAEFLRIQH